MKVEQVAKEMVKVVSNVKDAVHAKRLSVPTSSSGYKGFFVIHSVKGAALVGFERGYGMAFKVQDILPDGTAQLSPPVIVKVSKVAVGLQLGYNSVYSLVLMPDDAQLEALASDSETIMGKDFDLSGMGHPDASNVETTFHRTSITASSHGVRIAPTTLSVSDSLMVCDVSLYGGTLKVDKELMAQAYGDAYGSPLDVLRGKVAVPEALQALVSTITASISELTAPKVLLHVA